MCASCHALEGADNNKEGRCEYCSKWGCAEVSETEYQCAPGFMARVVVAVLFMVIGGMFGLFIGILHWCMFGKPIRFARCLGLLLCWRRENWCCGEKPSAIDILLSEWH